MGWALSDDIGACESTQSESTSARELPPEQAAAAAMVAEAKVSGLALTGPDGLLKLFTKNVLETAFIGEMTEHLGHEKHQVGPDRESTKVRNGTRPKTVISDAAGEVGESVAVDHCPILHRPPHPEHVPAGVTAELGRGETRHQIIERPISPGDSRAGISRPSRPR